MASELREVLDKFRRFELATPEKQKNIGRSHYPKVTLTLPPEIVEKLHVISGKRKAAGQRDAGLNAIVVEALIGYFPAMGEPLPGLTGG